ncbi:MAG TPA: site-2 protease family protein [Terriglobales bacterium]|nr:site-2 protease family protein [Terriglobales bacterium]
MNWSVPLGRVFDTEVRAHWSWIIILAFIAVVFSTDLSAQASAPAGWNLAWAWGTSIVTAALVFVSVLVHELAHVAVARRNGMRSPAVVIQLIGGAFAMEMNPKNPGEEFRVAIAGSALSFLLMFFFGGVTLVLAMGPVNADSAPLALQALEFVTFVLTIFNGFLGGINLVPGYPLDGARVAHAIAWRRTGDEVGASAVAVRLGRYTGLSLVATGVFVALYGDPTAGLCVGVGGWLIAGASGILNRRAQLRRLVTGLRVADAEDPDVARIPPQLTLDVFAGEYLAERTGTAALVERGTELVGLIGTAQIRRVPRRAWPNTHTEQVMVPIGSVPSAARDSDLWAALEVLERAGLDAMLVSGSEDGPVLMTRRAAARIVRERVEAQRRQVLAGGQLKKGRFRGR